MVRKSALGHCSKLTRLHTEHPSTKGTERENHGSHEPQVEERDASAKELPGIQPELSQAITADTQKHSWVRERVGSAVSKQDTSYRELYMGDSLLSSRKIRS